VNKINKILKIIRPELDYEGGGGFVSRNMLDSLDVIRLVAELETVFGISINGADILPENFDSLGSIAELVRKSGGTVE